MLEQQNVSCFSVKALIIIYNFMARPSELQNHVLMYGSNNAKLPTVDKKIKFSEKGTKEKKKERERDRANGIIWL